MSWQVAGRAQAACDGSLSRLAQRWSLPCSHSFPLCTDEVKFAWKIQRDMAERGHSLKAIQASIEARKPDFDAYIDPQKKKADAIIEVHTVGWMWVAFAARLCVSA